MKRQSVPAFPGYHPEMDTLEFLDDDGHLYYQMLFGMLNWIVGIGRFDIAHATSLLARFASFPRKRAPRPCLEGVWLLEKVPE